MSDVASWKQLAREAAHEVFAVPSLYQDAARAEAGLDPIELMVRWHGKMLLTGGDGMSGYATTMDTAERVVFDRAELDRKGVDPVRSGTVTLPGYITRSGPLAFVLDTREPYDGPTNLTWNVARDI